MFNVVNADEFFWRGDALDIGFKQIGSPTLVSKARIWGRFLGLATPGRFHLFSGRAGWTFCYLLAVNLVNRRPRAVAK
jgi:hypothetical protein